MLGNIEGKRRQQQRIRWLDGICPWHVQLNGHEFEQTPEYSEGRRSLVCCSPWGHKESDSLVTELQFISVPLVFQSLSHIQVDENNSSESPFFTLLEGKMEEEAVCGAHLGKLNFGQVRNEST